MLSVYDDLVQRHERRFGWEKAGQQLQNIGTGREHDLWPGQRFVKQG